MVIGATGLIPLFLDTNVNTIDVIILGSIFIISVGFFIWTAFFIKYVFYKDFLLVKGGPIRSKIPYDEITQISFANDMYSGFRILSSKDAIEILYKKALLRSVKVSPENKELFISEIKKRCPGVKVHNLIF